jgi:mRNA interferase MazF
MKRFEIWLARLDPAEGPEMRKTRPVVIVSPDELNARLLTVLVAPLTSHGFVAPFRVPCRFAGVNGQVALDHLRALSKTRCIRHCAEPSQRACGCTRQWGQSRIFLNYAPVRIDLTQCRSHDSARERSVCDAAFWQGNKAPCPRVSIWGQFSKLFILRRLKRENVTPSSSADSKPLQQR